MLLMALTKSDGTIISADIEYADTFLKKLTGVMFRKSIAGALIFDMGYNSYDGIHMLFVRFPIDVVFLGPDRKVVDVRSNLRPWTGSAFPRSGSAMPSSFPPTRSRKLRSRLAICFPGKHGPFYLVQIKKLNH